MSNAAPKPPSQDWNSSNSDQWVLYLNQLSAYASGIDTSGIAVAQSAATGAQTDATTALGQIALLNASPSLWVAGDYKQTAQASLGTGWLVCDGSDFTSASYPALETVLAPITSAGAGPGTRKLPSLPDTFDTAHPGPGGPAVVRWWVRAL